MEENHEKIFLIMDYIEVYYLLNNLKISIIFFKNGNLTKFINE